MDHTKKSTYLFSVDALRVVAILAVILIHQTTTTLQVLNHNVNAAPFTLFLNQASRFAVPLFFLISGFVLELNNKNDLSYLTFFKKRASRILVPYLFWSIVYIGIWKGFEASTFLSRDFIEKLFNGTASYHLYFIPTLIIFYLLFPFFHKFIKAIKNPLFISIIFVIQMAISFFNYYYKVLPVQEDIRVAFLVFAMFLFGMAASHHIIIIQNYAKKYFKALLFITIILLGVIFEEVFKLTIDLNTTSFIYNQYSPLNYIYTLALSGLLFYYFENKTKFRKITIQLSRLSFFVFFIHVIVLQNVWVNLSNQIIEKNGKSILANFWFDPLIFIFVTIISFTIAYLVSKIPYVSKITG